MLFRSIVSIFSSSMFIVSSCSPRAHQHHPAGNHPRDPCLTVATRVEKSRKTLHITSTHHRASPQSRPKEGRHLFPTTKVRPPHPHDSRLETTHQRKLLHVRDKRREVAQISATPPASHVTPHPRIYRPQTDVGTTDRALTCSWAPGTTSSGARGASHGYPWCG